MTDMVNHPPHYNSDPSGVEYIEITRHRNFNVGNAIKYLWRAGLKADPDKAAVDKQVEDLRKAIFYINDEIERLRPALRNLPDEVADILNPLGEVFVTELPTEAGFYEDREGDVWEHRPDAEEFGRWTLAQEKGNYYAPENRFETWTPGEVRMWMPLTRVDDPNPAA